MQGWLATPHWTGLGLDSSWGYQRRVQEAAALGLDLAGVTRAGVGGSAEQGYRKALNEVVRAGTL